MQPAADPPPADAWAPWPVAEVSTRLRGAREPWCVAGGVALDLWLGRDTRPHGDLEIVLPRASFAGLRYRFAGLPLFCVHDGVLQPLRDNLVPPDQVHQVWVLDPQIQRWRVDLMLEPGTAATWVFRRDERVHGARSELTGRRNGVPYLAPQCVLLFKAKACRPKDEQDLTSCLPHLDAEQRRWLREALELAHPGHPWLDRIP